jgi:peptidoglycan/xylan/chitin deacetylase (PgdA/CDA1 family)
MSLARKISQVFGDFTMHDGVIVLTYHRVNDRLPKGQLVVHPSDFKRQMGFLSFYRRRFEVIGVGEMIEWMRDLRDTVCRRTATHGVARTKIVISFDDGYRDNYIHAFPVLKKYKFPAVISLTTDYIGSEHKNERYKNLPWKRDYLNKDEIREMMDNGISFGVHTATHPHLTEISQEEAESQIVKSRETCRASLNLPYKFLPFCYPYGDYNEKIKEMVRKAGFKCAFSVKPGINYKGQDLFEIKRIDVTGEDSFASFKYKLTEKYVGHKDTKTQGHKV